MHIQRRVGHVTKPAGIYSKFCVTQKWALTKTCFKKQNKHHRNEYRKLCLTFHHEFCHSEMTKMLALHAQPRWFFPAESVSQHLCPACSISPPGYAWQSSLENLWVWEGTSYPPLLLSEDWQVPGSIHVFSSDHRVSKSLCSSVTNITSVRVHMSQSEGQLRKNS